MKIDQFHYEVSASYATTLESGRGFYMTINQDKKGKRKLYLGSKTSPTALAGDFIIDNADEMDEITAFSKEAVRLFDEQFGRGI